MKELNIGLGRECLEPRHSPKSEEARGDYSFVGKYAQLACPDPTHWKRRLKLENLETKYVMPFAAKERDFLGIRLKAFVNDGILLDEIVPIGPIKVQEKFCRHLQEMEPDAYVFKGPFGGWQAILEIPDYDSVSGVLNQEFEISNPWFDLLVRPKNIENVFLPENKIVGRLREICDYLKAERLIDRGNFVKRGVDLNPSIFLYDHSPKTSKIKENPIIDIDAQVDLKAVIAAQFLEYYKVPRPHGSHNKDIAKKIGYDTKKFNVNLRKSQDAISKWYLNNLGLSDLLEEKGDEKNLELLLKRLKI